MTLRPGSAPFVRLMVIPCRRQEMKPGRTHEPSLPLSFGNLGVVPGQNHLCHLLGHPLLPQLVSQTPSSCSPSVENLILGLNTTLSGDNLAGMEGRGNGIRNGDSYCSTKLIKKKYSQGRDCSVKWRVLCQVEIILSEWRLLCQGRDCSAGVGIILSGWRLLYQCGDCSVSIETALSV